MDGYTCTTCVLFLPSLVSNMRAPLIIIIERNAIDSLAKHTHTDRHTQTDTHTHQKPITLNFSRLLVRLFAPYLILLLRSYGTKTCIGASSK